MRQSPKSHQSQNFSFVVRPTTLIWALLRTTLDLALEAILGPSMTRPLHLPSPVLLRRQRKTLSANYRLRIPTKITMKRWLDPAHLPFVSPASLLPRILAFRIIQGYTLFYRLRHPVPPLRVVSLISRIVSSICLFRHPRAQLSLALLLRMYPRALSSGVASTAQFISQECLTAL